MLLIVSVSLATSLSLFLFDRSFFREDEKHRWYVTTALPPLVNSFAARLN